MKRRTLDASKLRRPIRRSRITDSVHGSWLLYLRFFIVWLLVITMDFLLEFRFEFLWPFWLLIRSIYDSFRYQGLGLTILFFVVTLCADLLCLVVLPVHWLFFAASTYVWVHFVWNTDRGPCLPTLSLWLLFVYVEASVRLRGIKTIPFHLDLCRPFAAHCIGYPMVSLGYGFKSYVGCRIKQYKQEDVSKENDFYHQLISYALPLELQKQTNDKVLPGRTSDDSLTLINRKAQPPVLTNGINTKTDVEALLAREASKRGLRLSDLKADIEDKQGALSLTDLELISNIPAKTISIDRKALANGDYENGGVRLAGSKTKTDSRRITFKTNQRVLNSEIIVDDDDNNESDSSESTASSGILKTSSNNSPKSARDSKAIEASLQARIRDENQARRRLESQTSQLESDMKRLRFELHSSRQQETELRAQLNTNYANERYLKSEISRLRTECDGFQQKITSLSNTSKQDKVSVTSLEKKLKIEREARNNLEQQLKESKKKSKLESDAFTSQRDNHDTCVAKRQDLEQELVHMRGKMTDQEERIAELDAENEELKRKSQDNEGLKLKKETELLYSALTAMQGKNTHLENSLSSETRLKLDLFSALGDTRRQLEIVQGQLAVKEKDLEAFKAKIAEVMAVMPQNYSDGSLAGFVSHGNHVDASGGGLVKTSSYMPTTSSYLPTTSSYMPTTSSYNPVTKNGIL
eukprot:gene469-1113_t